jgi:UDP:flavonoid glycosyltransferase YjiC (YdhE family)
LAAALESILAPQLVTRPREIAAKMTKPRESVSSAADLVEDAAHPDHIG